MRKVKMVPAHEGKTVKSFLVKLAEEKVRELQWKGILPKGNDSGWIVLGQSRTIFRIFIDKAVEFSG